MYEYQFFFFLVLFFLFGGFGEFSGVLGGFGILCKDYWDYCICSVVVWFLCIGDWELG